MVNNIFHSLLSICGQETMAHVATAGGDISSFLSEDYEGPFENMRRKYIKVNKVINKKND